MAKTKKPKRTDESALVRARHAFDAARRAYDALQTERERLMQRVREIDAALADLPEPGKPAEPAPHGRSNGASIQDVVRAKLGKVASMHLPDLVEAVVRARQGTAPGSVRTILRRMRLAGEVRVTGQRGDYSYALFRRR